MPKAQANGIEIEYCNNLQEIKIEDLSCSILGSRSQSDRMVEEVLDLVDRSLGYHF